MSLSTLNTGLRNCVLSCVPLFVVVLVSRYAQHTDTKTFVFTIWFVHVVCYIIVYIEYWIQELFVVLCSVNCCLFGVLKRMSIFCVIRKMHTRCRKMYTRSVKILMLFLNTIHTFYHSKCSGPKVLHNAIVVVKCIHEALKH